MKKRIFRKNLFRLTGAAMTTVMVLGSTVQAWAKSGGNEIISADNVAGGGSSTDDYYSNVDLDDYDSWLRDLISECISKSDSKEDYLPGGVYHDTHVRQEHYEFNEPRLEDGSWQFDVEEWGVSVTDPVNYERDDGDYTSSQTNRYNDTISIVDLSHSWENYSEQAYQIFLPIEGKLSVNHYINSDSYRRAFDEGGSINVYHPWYDETRHDGCTYTINEFSDYLKEIVGDTALTTEQVWSAQRTGKDREDKPEYKVKMKVAFVFSNKVQLIQHYHNSSWLEHGGSPDKAMQAAFTNQIDGWLKANSKYNKTEGKIKFTDIADCLVFISSNFSTQTSYENQTKKSITNKFIQEAMTDWLKHQLEVYFLENTDEEVKICEQVLINKRARENAAKARDTIKKQLSGKIDLANRIPKFVDCRSKDTARRELYIVEGDSALGAVKQARDADYQAVMPVRGKTLNCLKASYDKIFKSEIITNLMKILGCGVEVKAKANKDLSTFDLNNLRWEKIIICTDADYDGYQIRTLILTMLYRLVPTVIEKGFVYIAESPLYEINSKDMTYFAYTEAEKQRILADIGEQKYKIQRSKGLGENEPEMMSLTTMNPETRRLIRVMPEDAQKTQEIFELLLGDNLDGRKDYIRDYGYKYLDDIDVS